MFALCFDKLIFTRSVLDRIKTKEKRIERRDKIFLRHSILILRKYEIRAVGKIWNIMAVKNVAKEWSACLEAGLQERGAARTLERFIGNSFSLYFVSRRFTRCSATAVHMYAGLILGYNTVCGERYRWLSTELVW